MMDTLDSVVLIAVFLALVAYFTKGKLWAVENKLDEFTNHSSSNDIVETLKKSGKKAVVFFGSQTGTAEDYAHKFAKEFQSRFSIPTMVADLADYSFENFQSISSEISDFKLTTFFMATYGEGEPTDNAVEFFDYLENEAEDLTGLKFSCFGLGNSTYEFYNAIVNKTVDQLLEKKAELVGEIGLGDDGTGSMDEDYLSWKDSLFDVIKDTLGLEEQEMSYQPSIEVKESSTLTVKSSNVSLGEPNSKYVNPKTEEELDSLKYGPFDHTHPYLAPITKSKELFNSETRHCIHAEFDLSGSNLKYSTGDHVAIWPSNSDEKVFKLLSVLGLEIKRDQVIEIKSLDSTLHLQIPSPTTYESVLRYYLEISGPVSRQFLKSIVQFAPDAETQEKIKTVSDSKESFQKEVTEKYLNISDALDVLSLGKKWSSVPFEFIIESIAKLQPRYYSISSSSSSEKQTVHVTAVVEQENPIGSDHLVTGVATNLLLHINAKQNKLKDLKLFQTYNLEGPRSKFSLYKLPIHIRRSTFKLPSNPATPIVMIGPGTGVAPFRGFVREKVKQVENGNKNIGELMLFFGCRSSTEDFLYKNEWTDYSKKLDKKFSLITAFSRENGEKIYVQHKLAEYSSKIIELMNKGAFFYVCGDASRMSRDVQNTLVTIYKEEKKLTEEIASDMVKQLKVMNRYQEDVW